MQVKIGYNYLIFRKISEVEEKDINACADKCEIIAIHQRDLTVRGKPTNLYHMLNVLAKKYDLEIV